MTLIIRYLVMLVVLIVFIFSSKVSEKKWLPVILLIVFLGLGPIDFANECRQWVQILKQRNVEIHLTKWLQINLNTPPSGNLDQVEKKAVREEKTTYPEIVRSIVATEASQSAIRNGDFEIPFGHELSAWGHGFYTDRIRQQIPGAENLVWINFLNANISIFPVKTDTGSALKIVNSTGPIPNKVGIVEQKIKVIPGRYRFSFWAKGEQDLQFKAIQFVTTQDWYIVDPNTKKQRGYELQEGGPFDWREFSGEIDVDVNGLLTFTIVSKNSGTLYVSDLRLVKIKS